MPRFEIPGNSLAGHRASFDVACRVSFRVATVVEKVVCTRLLLPLLEESSFPPELRRHHNLNDTKSGDPLEMAFGYEDDPGLANVFLSVYDKRLRYDAASSAAVNAVTEKAGDGDGGGCYLSLRTGKYGIGVPVDDSTMAVYLKRFGVPEEQIETLPLNIPKPGLVRRTQKAGEGVCPSCQKPGTKRCGKCGSRVYCSDICQRQDWPVHKILCSLHPFPSKPEGEFVRASLLPEGSPQPQIVHVRVRLKHHDGFSWWSPELKPVLCEGMRGSIRSDLLPSWPPWVRTTFLRSQLRREVSSYKRSGANHSNSWHICQSHCICYIERNS